MRAGGGGRPDGGDGRHDQLIASASFAFKASHFTREKDGAPSDIAPPLSADADKGDQDPLILAPSVARTLTRGAESAGKGGYAGRRQEDDDNLIALQQNGTNLGFELPSLRKGDGGFTSGVPAVAFDMRGREGGAQFEGPHDTANIRAASGGSSRSYVGQPWAVRRLTPTECERLQGFPDGYTAIQVRGKPAADGPRYKALGNSMAVNVMRWIGARIQVVDELTRELAA